MSKKLNIVLGILGAIYVFATMFPLFKNFLKKSNNVVNTHENKEWVEVPFLTDK